MDGEFDTRVVLREILNNTRSLNSIGCGASAEMQRNHSERITALEIQVGHVNQDTKEIKSMLKDALADGGNTKDRVLKMETEKRTWIAVITSVAVAVWEVIKTFLGRS